MHGAVAKAAAAEAAETALAETCALISVNLLKAFCQYGTEESATEMGSRFHVPDVASSFRLSMRCFANIINHLTYLMP